MKVVILAGGLGSRLSEETVIKPKPMVEIGGKPIIWHIMKIYAHYGFNDFVICLGYKGHVIKNYFYNYFLYQSDVTIDLSTNSITHHNSEMENWKITLVDTGADTMTGGRIKRVKKYLDNQPFMLTYGDGVGNVDLKKLQAFHASNGKLATVTAVQPSGKFGALLINEQHEVQSFQEKPKAGGSWINGGFFVCQPQVLDYIENDQTIWERTPLEKLVEDGQLSAFHHHGFWKPMDTMKDKIELNELWDQEKADWKIW